MHFCCYYLPRVECLTQPASAAVPAPRGRHGRHGPCRHHLRKVRRLSADDWNPPDEIDLTKEEEPTDRSEVGFERTKHSIKLGFGEKRFIQWKSDAPSGGRDSLITAAAILGITAAAAFMIGVAAATWVSAPWWAVLGFAALLAVMTIGTGIYLANRHTR